jgi:O-antigen/teichoic acid export membrane protein
VALITFPFTALALALAEPLVLLVLGAQWKDAASLFAGFSLVALCLPLAIAATWLMVSQGRGRDLLRTYTVNACALLAAVLAGLPWGPVGVVLALAAVTATIRLPNLYYVAGRHGPVRTTDLWKGFFTHLPCWAAVFVATTLASGFIGEAEPLPRVLGCGLVGLAAGAGATFAFHGSRRSALFIGQALRSRGPWSHTTPVARA